MNNQQIWDDEYDVVVIGSGFAGLAAAIEAKQAGARVIIIEKMGVPGGNSAINGGLLAVAGSPLQSQTGINDSPTQLLTDMKKAGMDLNYPDLAQIVADKSLEILYWTQDFLGVKYRDTLSHLGGHSVPRTYITSSGNGSGLIQPMLAKCRELEIPLLLKTICTKVLKNSAHQVEGIVAHNNYLFPQKGSGELRRIRSYRGVILASGGFSRDIEFRTTQDPRLSESVDSTNHLGATADGLIAALQAGATPVHLSWIQLGPWASFEEKGWGVGSMFTLLAGFPYGIMVDANTGKRFVNESSDRKLRTDAMLDRSRIPVAILDSEGVKHATTLDTCLKKGIVKAFDSIESLAIAFQIPLVALKETLERYHLSLMYGRDTEFGKLLTSECRPIEHPPFYAIRLLPKVHHCMGGVQINKFAQVIGLEERQPIPGFYAAGEAVGGIHGASRLGSTSIVDCLAFGRIAGQHAALNR